MGLCETKGKIINIFLSVFNRYIQKTISAYYILQINYFLEDYKGKFR